eukprot:5398422-Prymnesium_polylepis.2
MVLELRHGAMVRLEPGELSDFRAATNDLAAPRALAIALYLCSRADGVGRAPVDLMRMEIQRSLEGATPEDATAFCVASLCALPAASPPSLLALGASLFFTPLKAVVPAACRTLLAAANAPQRRALHRLGCAIGDGDLLGSLAASVRGTQTHPEHKGTPTTT